MNETQCMIESINLNTNDTLKCESQWLGEWQIWQQIYHPSLLGIFESDFFFDNHCNQIGACLNDLYDCKLCLLSFFFPLFVATQ